MPPIDDSAFLAAPDGLEAIDSSHVKNFVRLLRLGKFEVIGRLEARADGGDFGPDIWRVRDQYRPSSVAFNDKSVDVLGSRVNLTGIAMDARRDRALFDEIVDVVTNKDQAIRGDESVLERLQVFLEDATVPTKTLLDLFPSMAAAGVKAGAAMGRDTKSKSTVLAGTMCERWLLGLMKSGPNKNGKNNYRTAAMEKFNVSRRGFDRAWANAAKIEGNERWSNPGRKSSK